MKVLSKKFVLLTLLGLAVAPRVGACSKKCKWLQDGGCSKLYGVCGEFFNELTQNIKSLNELNTDDRANTEKFISLAAKINDNACWINVLTQNSSCPKNCPILGNTIQATTRISHATSWLIIKSLYRNCPELERTRAWMNSHFEILQKNIVNSTKE